MVGMAAMSELHGTECLKMIRRLCRVHGNLVLGAQQVQLNPLCTIDCFSGIVHCVTNDYFTDHR